VSWLERCHFRMLQKPCGASKKVLLLYKVCATSTTGAPS
jgi:hypothetical protein